MDNPYKRKFIVLNPKVKRKRYTEEYNKLLDQFPELKAVILRNKKRKNTSSLRTLLSNYNSSSKIPEVIQDKLGINLDRIGNKGSTTFIMYITDNKRDNEIHRNKYYPVLTFDTGEEFIKVTAIQGFYNPENLVANWKIPFGKYFKVRPILGSLLHKMDIPIITKVVVGDFTYELMDRKYILPFEITNQIYNYGCKIWKCKGKEFRKNLRNFRSLMSKIKGVPTKKLLELSAQERENLVMQIFKLIWYGRRNYQDISEDIETVPTFYFPKVQQIFEQLQGGYKKMVEKETQEIRHTLLGDYL